MTDSKNKLRQLPDQLEECQEMLDALLQQSLMGVVVIQDFRVVQTNRKYCDICEYTMDEILGWGMQDMLKLVHPEDMEFVIGQLKKKQDGETNGVVTAYSYRGVTKTGKVGWLDQHSQTVTWRGKPANMITLIDVTEHRETQEALSQSQKELQQRVEERTAELQASNEALAHEEETLRTERAQLLEIFNSIDAPIYVCDIETHALLFVNKAIEAIWGDVLGKQCFRVFQGLDEPCPFCTNPEITKKNLGEAHIWDYENRTNQRWYHCIDQAFRWSDGRIARLEIAIDIDQRKRAEERLQLAYKDLQELDRLKDNFISNVSHELRTPLVTAKGYAELLLRKSELGVKDRERIQKIHRGINRLETIIADLLDISKLHAGAMSLDIKAVDMASAVAGSVSALKPRLKEQRIEVQKDFPPDLPLVRADKLKLQSAIQNLVENAIKFSPEESQITLSASAEDDGTVVVAVRDQGIGIARENHEKVFSRFFQVDSSSTRLYDGAGIGLALVKEIVEIQGGEVWVESEEGKGATFLFSLPAIVK